MRNPRLLLGALALLSASTPAWAVPDGPAEVMANRAPLKWVVKQVVPAGVPVVYEPPVSPEMLITMAAGPSWQAALASAVEARGFTALYEESRVIIQPPAAQTGFATGPQLAGWRLRMATPGHAWIVGPGQEKLGPAEVREGESHPVLGRIVRILRDGDRWIVQTQKGWFVGGPT